MTITRELLKAEIDKVQDRYLEILYRIIQALINPLDIAPPHTTASPQSNIGTMDWHNFIDQTYGCLADDPIERGEQGDYEIREVIE